MKDLSGVISIEEAISRLKNGGIVAFPTETVYGLGARVFDPIALAKIFAAKRRPSDNPLIVHIAHLHDVARLAIDIPPSFFSLYSRFFPGPLTVVLKKHPDVPGIVSAGMDSIAIRMPSHPVARALIEGVKEPIAAPSANLSGKPSSTEARHVLEDFSSEIDGVVDGGEAKYGLESTVISLLSDPPVLLRPGTITKEQLEQALGCSVRLKNETDAAVSPGMKYRHYAPKAEVRLFTDEAALAQALTPDVFVISSKQMGLRHANLSAQTLYKTLRAADRDGVEKIFVLCDEAALEDPALMNRLLHSAKIN